MTFSVPEFLAVPGVALGKYTPEAAAELIAGRYGSPDAVLDFITEQVGERTRELNDERVRGLAKAYRSPHRRGTVTGCEALHWVAFGFLVSEDEVRRREQHLGWRWCHAPFHAARSMIEAAMEVPPRYDTEHDRAVIENILSRLAEEDGGLIDTRTLLARYDRDGAEEKWRYMRLRAASRRLVCELQRGRVVAWGTPTDDSGRREIPMSVLTASGLIFSAGSEFRPDGEAPTDIWMARRKEPVWREVVFQAEPVYGLRDLDREGAGNPQPSTRKKQSVPYCKLSEYMKKIREDDGPIPAADKLYSTVVTQFPDYDVTREDVRSVHAEVFGKQPRGRRRNSAA